MYSICFSAWIMIIVFSNANGTANLTVPPSVNCGEQAELMCSSTDCNQGYRFIRDGVTIYTNGGPISRTDPGKYSATVTSDSQVLLTITNIQISDAGAYQCACGFGDFSAQQTLRYECKAFSSTAAISANKKLRITVDRLYPQPFTIVTSLINQTSQLPGTYTCRSSPTLASHYTCTWNSTASLPDGNYGYNITVTTGTQVSPVFGSFKIVTPTSPTISNLVTISNNRQVVLGAQDTPLIIQCVSIGGIPAPTLALYRGSTNTSPLAQSTTSDSVQQSDGTYTVTLIHTFTPGRSDDMTTFLCRVFYPGATSGASPDPSPASALLYLDLKPDKQTVSQTGEAVSGGHITLECTSANGRPAASITWSYRGQTYTPTNTLEYDPTSETYTVVSVLQRPVSAVDNGQTATCRVIHTLLSVPLHSVIKVDVKYPPTVTVSATTSPPYTVSCTVEGFPTNYTYQNWLQIWQGYGPVATIPFTGTTLILTDVTYEMSGVYICGASNGINVYDTDVTYMKGNTTVLIKAPPILTDPSPEGTRIRVVGRLGQNATTEIKYWSNVNDSVVRCYKLVAGSRTPFSSCYVTETVTKIKLPVYNYSMTETGTLAAIKIPIRREEDLSDYDVVVTNSVLGESVLGITVIPQGPPSTPTITDLSFVAGQVRLTVVPGFHGELNQTIVVQTSTDHKTWHNNSSVNIGKVLSHTTLEISNLQPNHLHYVRAYALNSEGQSQNYSAVLNVAVKQDEGSYCSSISSTLAVSVSTTAFITIIFGIIVIVIVFRKYPNFIMRILQHTCPGNVPKGHEKNTVMQSQTSTGLERQMVFSTLVAAENPTRGENVEATPAYESLNQTRDQSVYTSLEATAYENLKRQ